MFDQMLKDGLINHGLIIIILLLCNSVSLLSIILFAAAAGGFFHSKQALINPPNTTCQTPNTTDEQETERAQATRSRQLAARFTAVFHQRLINRRLSTSGCFSAAVIFYLNHPKRRFPVHNILKSHI